jgi:hypothetical protein
VDEFARRAFAWAALAPVAMLIACGSQKLGAQGATCLQATDCQEGLVCVPQPKGANVCSSDLSTIQLTEDATAPAMDAGAKRDAGTADAAVDDAPGADAPGADDAAQEDVAPPPPPVDAAAPADASTGTPDAAPPDDAPPE